MEKYLLDASTVPGSESPKTVNSQLFNIKNKIKIILLNIHTIFTNMVSQYTFIFKLSVLFINFILNEFNHRFEINKHL